MPPSKSIRNRLVKIAKNMQKMRVLVIGDMMLDQFIYGMVERISPEAPVPVVKVEDDILRLGGSANVAANLKALGARVVLCGIVGKDNSGQAILDLCEEQGIGTEGLVATAQRNTTIKTRIIAHHQQVVRIDRENSVRLPKRLCHRIIRRLEKLVTNTDAVIVSDYGKGVIGKLMLDNLRAYKKERGTIVNVDPTVDNSKYYKKMTLMTPNHHEAGQMLGMKIPNEDKAIEKVGQRLLRKLALDALVITRGNGGMTLFADQKSHIHIPTRARQVFDVTGAGDTVIAALTLAMAGKANLREAAELANYAAGVVVGKLGTATTDVNQLIGSINRDYS